MKEVNCRTGETIYVGETLWVPYLAPTSTPRPRPTRTPRPTATGTLATTPTTTPTPTATGSVTVEPTTGTPDALVHLHYADTRHRHAGHQHAQSHHAAAYAHVWNHARHSYSHFPARPNRHPGAYRHLRCPDRYAAATNSLSNCAPAHQHARPANQHPQADEHTRSADRYNRAARANGYALDILIKEKEGKP